MRIAFLLLFLPLLSNCTTVQKTKNEFPAERPWVIEGEKRAKISGTGFVSWRTAKENIAAPGVLILEAPDKLRLEVQDPAGGVHALLILNDGRFFWFGAREPNNWVGPVERLRNLTSVSLSGRYLVRALAGAVAAQKFVFTEDSSWQKSEDGVRETVTEIYSGDLGSWELEHMERKWKVIAEYQDYAVRFGVAVPQFIKIELQERGEFKSRFTWKWNDLRLEGALDDKLLQIPAGTVFGKSTRTLK